MKVKLWGVRGSIPTPTLPEVLDGQRRGLLHGFFKSGYTRAEEIETYLARIPRTFISGYGGNTLCVGVKTEGETRLFIDGGSGLCPAGYEVMAGPAGRGKGETHLFFTHFHWDHLLGIPFFTPIYIPGNVIHLYAVEGSPEEAMRILFQKPYFPVPYEKLGAKIVYHTLEARKPFRLGELSITPYQLDHPDPCWGYRIEENGRAYAHCVDTECKRFSVAELGEDAALYRNADLMLFDAQYTLLESIEKVDWGHSTANLGFDLAHNLGVKRVAFTHHNPSASDRKIHDAEGQTREYERLQREALRNAGKRPPALKWFFAREGDELEV